MEPAGSRGVTLFSNVNGPVVNLLISRVTRVWLFFWDRWGLWRGAREQRSQPARFGDKVSVVIPTFNRVDLLFSRSLPSVLGQTYNNLEILVVSHGSTDGTSHKVEALGSKDSRVRLIEIDRKSLGYPNKAEFHWLAGPVRPINAGLRAATGAWIARIDDDDEWLPDHLDKLVAFADKNALDFVSSSYEVLDGSNDRVVKPTGTPEIGGVQTWVYRASFRRIYANINCWRKSWNRVNDTDLQDRLVGLNLRFGWVDEVTARIRPRAGENHIGSAAYLANSAEIERKYGIASP